MSSGAPWPCSVVSQLLDEKPAGSATRTNGFLLVEVPESWPRRILDSESLSPGLAHDLTRTCRELGLRLIFIRRIQWEHRSAHERLIAIVRLGATPSLKRWTIPASSSITYEELLGEFREASGWSGTERIMLVCGHAAHDPCCGRAAASLEDLPDEIHDRVFESSHLGGCRFAGNVLVLPEGISYGHVPTSGLAEILREADSGRLALRGFRGRSDYPHPAQAAEYYLRTALVDGRSVPLVLVSTEEPNTGVFEVRFATPTARYTAVVERMRAERSRMTCCSATKAGNPNSWSLVGIERLESSREGG